MVVNRTFLITVTVLLLAAMAIVAGLEDSKSKTWLLGSICVFAGYGLAFVYVLTSRKARQQ